MWLTYTHNHTWVSYAEKSSIKLQLLNKSANYNYMLKANHRHNYYKRKSLKFTIEGLRERNEHLDIVLFLPISQWWSISGVLFTGGRWVSDFSVLKSCYFQEPNKFHYLVSILSECLRILIDCSQLSNCYSLNVRRYNISARDRHARHILCVVHDDLGRNNWTTHYNCRFSACHRLYKCFSRAEQPNTLPVTRQKTATITCCSVVTSAIIAGFPPALRVIFSVS